MAHLLFECCFQDDESRLLDRRYTRGKSYVTCNLKTKDGLEKVREMCRTSDVLLDPYRPGVMERIGLNPIQLLQVLLQYNIFNYCIRDQIVHLNPLSSVLSVFLMVFL